MAPLRAPSAVCGRRRLPEVCRATHFELKQNLEKSNETKLKNIVIIIMKALPTQNFADFPSNFSDFEVVFVLLEKGKRLLVSAHHLGATVQVVGYLYPQHPAILIGPFQDLRYPPIKTYRIEDINEMLSLCRIRAEIIILAQTWILEQSYNF